MRSLMCVVTCVLMFLSVQAQDVTESRQSMSLGNYPSFSMTVRNMDAKVVEDVWKEYLKDLRGASPKKKKSEYFVDDAKMRDLSDNTVDVFSTVESAGQDTRIVVWFDLGGAFLNSEAHADKVPVAKKWLADFNQRIEIKRVELELEAEEGKLKDMTKEFDKLQKDQERLTKSIEDYKKKIEEAEAELVKNADAQKMQQDQMAAQQQVVERVKSDLKKKQ